MDTTESLLDCLAAELQRAAERSRTQRADDPLATRRESAAVALAPLFAPPQGDPAETSTEADRPRQNHADAPTGTPAPAGAPASLTGAGEGQTLTTAEAVLLAALNSTEGTDE